MGQQSILMLLLAAGVWYSSADLPSRDSWTDEVANADALFYDGNDATVYLKSSIGNGYLAAILPNSSELYVSGVFNGLSASESVEQGSDDISHRASIPSPLGFKLVDEISSGSALSLRNAAYYRYTDNTITSLYAHRQHRSTLVVDIEPSISSMVELNLESSPLWTSTVDLNIVNVTQQVVNGFTVNIVMGTTIESEAPGMLYGDVVDVVVLTTLPTPGSMLTVTFNETTTRHTFLTCVTTSLESSDPLKSALDQFQTVSSESSEQLWTEHVNAWDELWEAGVEVAGRYDVAVAINTSLYYLLSSVRDDHPFGISPGGLASNAYEGHSFWDCETWMFPPLALLQPDIAESLLQYRVIRIPAAETKALSYDPPYAGAMFPWESAVSGVEVCPTWAATGQLEQHISGDIVFAARTYFEVSGNTSWLANQGYALSSGVADWLKSRVSFDDAGQAHITDVIPPDEYAEGDDSVYTNYVSIQALRFAVDAAAAAGVEPDPDWSTIADALVLLEPSTDLDGATPEYLQYGGEEIKQADVVLLGFPLNRNISSFQRQIDLDYYAALTDPNGPAMTWAMHAVGYLELNNGQAPLDPSDKIAALFNQSFANVQEPWGVWTETPSGGATNFITGAGGFLQGVLFGFPGLRLTSQSVRFVTPTLMPGSSYYRARGVTWRGGKFDIVMDQSVSSQDQADGITCYFTLELTSDSVDGNVFGFSEEGSSDTTQMVLGSPVQFGVTEGSVLALVVL